MNEHPTAAGKSSYDLIDQELFWKALSVNTGMTVLDLACGAGRYSLPLAERIGPSGKVIAIDLWADGVAKLVAAAEKAGVNNVQTHVADVGQPLPIESGRVDLCLLATVLHDLVADGIARPALKEIGRVLKPSGILAVVEFNKQDGPPGPPKAVRLSLEEVSMLLMPLGLIRFSPVVELGPHTYFVQFRRLGGAR